MGDLTAKLMLSLTVFDHCRFYLQRYFLHKIYSLNKRSYELTNKPGSKRRTEQPYVNVKR